MERFLLQSEFLFFHPILIDFGKTSFILVLYKDCEVFFMKVSRRSRFGKSLAALSCAAFFSCINPLGGGEAIADLRKTFRKRMQ